jgi:hypothetical protein
MHYEAIFRIIGKGIRDYLTKGFGEQTPVYFFNGPVHLIFGG